MKVDTQVGPLTFTGFRDVVNGTDVEWHELVLVYRHKNRKIISVNVETSPLQTLREPFHRRVRLNLTHILNPLLLG